MFSTIRHAARQRRYQHQFVCFKCYLFAPSCVNALLLNLFPSTFYEPLTLCSEQINQNSQTWIEFRQFVTYLTIIDECFLLKLGQLHFFGSVSTLGIRAVPTNVIWRAFGVFIHILYPSLGHRHLSQDFFHMYPNITHIKVYTI